MVVLAISNGVKTIFMIVLMIVVMYLFFIKPQRDKQKEELAYRNGLKAGDNVMTLGGIHGKVVSNNAGYIMLEVAQGVQIKVGKSNITPIPSSETKKGKKRK